MLNILRSKLLDIESFLESRLSWIPYAVLVAATLAGVYFRIETYLINMPLWTDTVRLAVNLVERDYLGLLEELYGGQSAPAGFMMLSKFVGSFFNYSEPSLYAVTLMFSILGLFAFLYLSIYLLGPGLAPIAYVPMAFSNAAIFYAATFKQYSCELFFCTLILIISFKVVREGFTNRNIVLYGVIGVVSVWFSLSAIILLTGTGMVLMYLAIRDRRQHNLLKVLGVGLLVFFHFIALYLYQIRPAMPDLMEGYWAKSFAPIGEPLMEQVSWWASRSYNFFVAPANFSEPGVSLGIAAFVFGAVSTLAIRRYRIHCSVLLLPIVVTVLLVCVEKYPFTTGDSPHRARLTLFLVPVVYLMIAGGINRFASLVPARKLILITTLLVLSGPQLAKALNDPIVRYHDMRSVVSYLEEHYQDGDIVYADFRSVHSFRYYNRNAQMPFSGGAKTKSPDWHWDMDAIMKSGKRAWIVIAVGKGSRSRAYKAYLEEHHAPVSIKEFRRAWLLVCDPNGNPVLE